MAWYDEAVFYHIYPLGMTGAPKENSYGEPVHRLNTLLPWISHVKEIGCNAIYIGPLFESVGHGYETTDYKKLDSRLGTNEDLANFVAECHKQGIRVILDGVFNHTGRDFFAFQDLKKNRENSPYKDWYCNVNFWGNNSYNDGFSYENWGGYDLLVKLNQHNPAVRDYICDVIRFWVSEYDIDGIRLDAADVMDFNYMKALRQVANEVKSEFWLMGEVIHGDYSRWANEGTLHSVTNYMLHKALYSGHNDHNYFEIAHTIKYVSGMVGDKLKLYSFVDNHDVERIYTKLNNKAHYVPVHIMLYTLPGVPSLYYGSEFGIEGKKERFSDDSLRPALNYEDYKDAVETNPCTKLIAALGKIRQNTPALCYGDYKELLLQTTHFAYARTLDGKSVIVTVNNVDNEVSMELPAGNSAEYVGALSGERLGVNNGRISVKVAANSGEIWIPSEMCTETFAPVKAVEIVKAPQPEKKEEVKQEAPTGKAAVEEPKPAQAREEVSVKEPATETSRQDKTTEELSKESDCAGENQTEDMHDAREEESVLEKVQETVNTETVVRTQPTEKKTEPEKVTVDWSKSYEDMSVEELQEAILEKMRRNGPVTDYMLGTVRENTHHGSLVNWVKSFR